VHREKNRDFSALGDLTVFCRAIETQSAAAVRAANRQETNAQEAGLFGFRRTPSHLIDQNFTFDLALVQHSTRDDAESRVGRAGVLVIRITAAQDKSHQQTDTGSQPV
jgi:hypothetical protein